MKKDNQYKNINGLMRQSGLLQPAKKGFNHFMRGEIGTWRKYFNESQSLSFDKLTEQKLTHYVRFYYG